MACYLIAVTPEEKKIQLTSFSFGGAPEVEKEHFFTLSSPEHHGISIERVEDSLGDLRVQIEFVREALIRLYTQLALYSNAYINDVSIVKELPDETTIFISI